MSVVKINISIGELVDKVTILSIKLDKIKDETKRKNVKKEWDLLTKSMQECGINTETAEYKRLKNVNVKLWQIEDAIRIEEANENFTDTFIKLARSVYFVNDERAEIKKEINLKYNSELIEEKEYVDYKKGRNS